MSKRKKSITGIIVITVAILGVIAIAGATVYLRHEKTVNTEDKTIYLNEGTTYDQLVALLQSEGCISGAESFNALARLRRFHDNVHEGRYVITSHTPIYDLIGKLRCGDQDPLTLTIGRFRTLPTLCQAIGKRVLFPSDSLLLLLQDPATCARYGKTPSTVISLFVQDSYEVYWNITPSQFLDRMKKEHDRFWTASRLDKCDDLNLTPEEVCTIASIVDEETNQDDEKQNIASVYLNRIRKGMPLQADPTVRYAVGDFEIRRILKKHIEYDSPYNTYLHPGIPPGPICIPSQSSIDAVLANKKTDYIYFCAREDFSGYHNFAATLAEHNANANRYHKALNERNIK